MPLPVEREAPSAPVGLPLLPERPPEAAAYEWPVEGAWTEGREQSFELHASANRQRVRLVRLEHQEGGADVVFAGAQGDAVRLVTRHVVREGQEPVSYLVALAGLRSVRVQAGDQPADGEEVATAGERLRLRVRRVRLGSALDRALPEVAASALLDAPEHPLCDARNVLPLASATARGGERENPPAGGDQPRGASSAPASAGGGRTAAGAPPTEH